MSKFYQVELMYEGGGVLKINEDHILAVKQRTDGGYRVWLSMPLEVGDEPDRLPVLSGQLDEVKRQGGLRVLNVKSEELGALFPTKPAGSGFPIEKLAQDPDKGAQRPPKA